MSLSPWLSLVLAIPVLLMGREIARRVPLLSWYNIPHPVVGGLTVALVILLVNAGTSATVQFGTTVTAPWWTWLVTTGPEWNTSPAKAVHVPFMVAFFTCIGLNASWTIARKAGGQALVFLLITILLAVLQNVVGVAMAQLLGVSSLLGVVCGSVTLIGGHGTAMGFAGDFEKAGLVGAATLGAAAATFGMVAGSLVGGPVGGGLARRLAKVAQGSTHSLVHKNTPSYGLTPSVHLEVGATGQPSILQDIRGLLGLRSDVGGAPTPNLASLRKWRWTSLRHLLLILACVKAGAWVSYLIQQTGITFPVYMGALITGVVVRNTADVFFEGWIKTETVDTIGSVMLGMFLSMAMMTLNLGQLAGTALPMLAILVVQTSLMAAFAWFITFKAMGSDYEAAVMSAGQCGFGLGATSNAVATMKALVENFGPAPRAFLLVPVVGSFLVDLFNALNITVFLNLAHGVGP